MNKSDIFETAVVSFNDADILNGETPVIYGLNMTVNPGDLVYIIGKVGTGKTSIIRTVTGENRLLKGECNVCGYDMRTIQRKDIPYLRRKLGIIFQDFQLLMDRNVYDNLKFTLESTGWKDRNKIAERITGTLESVGMLTKAHKMPHQLSGGEQQRAAIARALLNNPTLILADEPTGNLDDQTSHEIMDLLLTINKAGTAIIMVTHNQALMKEYPARTLVCADGTCR